MNQQSERGRMKRKANKRTVSEQVRHALETCGLSRYAIAQRTGISEAVLSRFANGHTGLSAQNLDTLCELLGLELRRVRGRKAKG